jgi:hypothetical protein
MTEGDSKQILVIFMTNDIEVLVKGKKLPMNDFVANVINDVMLAILKNLRNVEIDKISKIEID